MVMLPWRRVQRSLDTEGYVQLWYENVWLQYFQYWQTALRLTGEYLLFQTEQYELSSGLSLKTAARLTKQDNNLFRAAELPVM